MMAADRLQSERMRQLGVEGADPSKMRAPEEDDGSDKTWQKTWLDAHPVFGRLCVSLCHSLSLSPLCVD